MQVPDNELSRLTARDGIGRGICERGWSIRQLKLVFTNHNSKEEESLVQGLVSIFSRNSELWSKMRGAASAPYDRLCRPDRVMKLFKRLLLCLIIQEIGTSLTVCLSLMSSQFK